MNSKPLLDRNDGYLEKCYLKMDISFADHCHLIGRKGQRIQTIMNQTGTHIHFPDSNKTALEKSNIVTINGQPEKVELARQMIRDNMPVTFSFVVDVANMMVKLNTNDPFVKLVQFKHNVTVSFKPTSRQSFRGTFISATVFVKGIRQEFDKIRDAVYELYNHFTNGSNDAEIRLFTIHIDISPQHHSFVQGKGNQNIKAIIQETGARIFFPEELRLSGSIHQVKTPAHSTVQIKSNSVENAFMAWQELLGYLPLALSFNITDSMEIDSHFINRLAYNECSLVKVEFDSHRRRPGVRSLVLKSSERNSTLLFDCRKKILKLDFTQSSTSPTYTTPTSSTADLHCSNFSSFNPTASSSPSLSPHLQAIKLLLHDPAIRKRYDELVKELELLSSINVNGPLSPSPVMQSYVFKQLDLSPVRASYNSFITTPNSNNSNSRNNNNSRNSESQGSSDSIDFVNNHLSSLSSFGDMFNFNLQYN